MIVESFCTSVFCLAIVLLAGYNIPLKEIVFSFFPINFWILLVYILLYFNIFNSPIYKLCDRKIEPISTLLYR